MESRLIPHKAEQSPPGLIPIWIALLPPVFLLGLLFFSVTHYRDQTVAGPAQVSLFLAGTFALVLAKMFRVSWRKLERSVLSVMHDVMQPVLILLLIGALIGVWILSGVVPGLIYWGLGMVHPSIFLPATAIISAIVSVATGSSWSTAGTIGVALMGISHAMGVNPAITAGAVVSGAYFGDKMSPFSETTNLAASLVSVELFDHVRHMLSTTLPAMLLSLVFFTILGISQDPGQSNLSNIAMVRTELSSRFAISYWLLLVPAITLGMVVARTPAIPAILAGIGAASVYYLFAELTQANQKPGPGFVASIQNLYGALATGYDQKTGNAILDGLLLRGGMSSMLGTIWLIFSAMFFAGVMEGSGMLRTLARGLLKRLHTTGDLIGGTMLTAVGVNLLAAEQFLSLVVTGRIFHYEYRLRGLENKNLSRAMEDSGTLTSPLIPWNTCGAFMAATLGVSAVDYFSYAFLNWMTPIISLAYAYTGFTIVHVKQNSDENHASFL